MKTKITLIFIILIILTYLAGAFIKDSFYWIQEMAQTEQGRAYLFFLLSCNFFPCLALYLIEKYDD